MAFNPITTTGPTTTVNTAAELLSAYAELSTLSGGGTILLQSGGYGNFSLHDTSGGSEPVIITSADPSDPAQFDYIYFNNVSNVRLESIHFDCPDNGTSGSSVINIDNGSQNIEIVDVEINGPVDSDFSGHWGIRIKDSSDVRIHDVDIHDVRVGIYAWKSQGIEIVGNTLDRLGDDGMKFDTVTDVLIEDNFGPRLFFPEPGAHLDFIQFQGADSSDVIVRGNVLLPENEVAVQGIFFDDAHYTNVLIEQNIIATGMIRGVSVSSGTNVVARDNTLIHIEGTLSKETKVLVDGESYGNIQSSYPQAAAQGTNLTLQYSNPEGSLHYSDVFLNADAVLGMEISDLIPTEGSLAFNYGATERLLELLGTDASGKDAPAEEPLAEVPTAEDPNLENPRGEDPRSDVPESVESSGFSSFLTKLLESFLRIFGLGGSDDDEFLPEENNGIVETASLEQLVPFTETLNETLPDGLVEEEDLLEDLVA